MVPYYQIEVIRYHLRVSIDIFKLKAGDRHVHERTFTADEVRLFAEVSGDRGAHHLTPDAQGRLMLHGLLTATMPTKLGGDMQFVARDMHFDFVKPAFSGEKLTCLGIVATVVAQRSRLKVAFSFTITRDGGEVVLQGTSSGSIYRKSEAVT